MVFRGPEILRRKRIEIVNLMHFWWAEALLRPLAAFAPEGSLLESLGKFAGAIKTISNAEVRV